MNNVFSLSPILQITFFLSGKNGKSLWLLNNVFGYSTSTSRKQPLLQCSSYIFYELFIKFW